MSDWSHMLSDLIGQLSSNSVKMLLGHKSAIRSTDRLPQVGTEAWDVLNGRRIDLIEKNVYGKLDHSEREELEKLLRICGAAVDKAFPIQPDELDRLILLRDQLRDENGAQGE
jgi:hypothetical protein